MEICCESVDQFGLPISEARTKTIDIDGKSIEAVLMAGGSGFKIYSIPDAVLLVIGKKKVVIGEKDKNFMTVMRYVNLRYQPIREQDSIKAHFDELVKMLSDKKSTNESKSYLSEDQGKGSIYTLILFEGCDLVEVLHNSHFATDEVDKYEEIKKICDEYFKDGVESRKLSFEEPGVLGKEDQTVLHLTDGDPYKDLWEKLAAVAEYKYPKFTPHVSVTSNVDSFSGMTSCLVISKNGEEMVRYDFTKPEKEVATESVDYFGIPLMG